MSERKKRWGQSDPDNYQLRNKRIGRALATGVLLVAPASACTSQSEIAPDMGSSQLEDVENQEPEVTSSLQERTLRIFDEHKNRSADELVSKYSATVVGSVEELFEEVDRPSFIEDETRRLYSVQARYPVSVVSAQIGYSKDTHIVELAVNIEYGVDESVTAFMECLPTEEDEKLSNEASPYDYAELLSVCSDAITAPRYVTGSIYDKHTHGESAFMTQTDSREGNDEVYQGSMQYSTYSFETGGEPVHEGESDYLRTVRDANSVADAVIWYIENSKKPTQQWPL